MFTEDLALTSPEPVPPLTVCLAPLPKRAILPASFRGKLPSFLRRTLHPAPDSLTDLQ